MSSTARKCGSSAEPGRSRQGLVGLDGRPVAAGGFLPPYIPMDATLYLGKEDGWPYQACSRGPKAVGSVETRRLGRTAGPSARKSSIEKINPSEIKLIYSDVKLNAKLRLEEFAFQAPPTANVDDGTETLIKGLDQAIQMEIQRKKTEAAKKEGPVLDQPIDVPAPPRRRAATLRAIRTAAQPTFIAEPCPPDSSMIEGRREFQ